MGTEADKAIKELEKELALAKEFYTTVELTLAKKQPLKAPDRTQVFIYIEKALPLLYSEAEKLDKFTHSTKLVQSVRQLDEQAHKIAEKILQAKS